MVQFDLPTDPRPENMDLIPTWAVQVAQSPFTGKEQVNQLPFSAWIIILNYVNQDGIYGQQAIRSFLMKLRGRTNTAKIILPGYEDAPGPSTAYAGANGQVAGASQTGTSINTDIWSNSLPILNEGDYFTLENELKMCTADISSDGSGLATIAFEPAIRVSPANNAVVTVDAPFGIFRSVENQFPMRVRAPWTKSFKLTFAEAII